MKRILILLVVSLMVASCSTVKKSSLPFAGNTKTKKVKRMSNAQLRQAKKREPMYIYYSRKNRMVRTVKF